MSRRRQPERLPDATTTPAQRAAYADTRVCAELGYVAALWTHDPDGSLVLVLTPGGAR